MTFEDTLRAVEHYDNVVYYLSVHVINFGNGLATARDNTATEKSLFGSFTQFLSSILAIATIRQGTKYFLVAQKLQTRCSSW